MSRLRQYLSKDVLTAAKERIHHIFDIFDTVTVCFSGGKDSLVVLNLCREVSEERGLSTVHALFRDEELIPDQVIDFVDGYRRKSWLNLLWFTVPLQSHKFYMGKVISYIQWDPNREHVRPKPEWGINLEPSDDRVLSQYTMDEFTAAYYKGKIAFLTGIRAAESLIRYRSCVNKLNENYINASESKRVSLCKPIYDWEEDDVFRYFYEREIPYCPWYDQQMWANTALRVTTPLCSEPAKHLQQSIPVDPQFYDRVLKLFPDMRTQARYWKEFDREAIFEKYGQDGFAGIFRYIDNEMSDESQKVKAREFMKFATNRTAGDFKIRDILGHVVNGQFRRKLMANSDKFDERKAAS